MTDRTGNRRLLDALPAGVEGRIWTSRQAAGFIRIVLAAVLLLARAGLGVAANAPLPPVAIHGTPAMQTDERQHDLVVTGMASTDTHRLLDGAPCCQDRLTPGCCGPGLGGTSVGVLPALTTLEWPTTSAVLFTLGPVVADSGIRASPVLPPPQN
jgi:hypothetical protein